MASVYVHLSGRDVDGALLQMYGIKDTTKAKDTLLKPKTCQKCQEPNGFANRFCKRCGTELREREAIIEEHVSRQEADGVLDKMLNDPMFKQLFVEKMKAILKQGTDATAIS